jgi:hypothetical protein
VYKCIRRERIGIFFLKKKKGPSIPFPLVLAKTTKREKVEPWPRQQGKHVYLGLRIIIIIIIIIIINK